MPVYLSIGDFSRATHMTVKTLRHYHEIGLLAPADVDPHTGYRRYTADQIAIAQVIRRFRNLGMPLEKIQGVLSAPDLTARNQRIAAHLTRLEEELGRTQWAIASLRDLLAPPSPADVPDRIELRSAPSVPAAAVTAVIDATDATTWVQGALGEIYAIMTAQNVTPTGPAGGIFTDDVFAQHHGQVIIFVPASGPVRPTGRVTQEQIPAAELAVIEYQGPPSDVDRAYGTLAAYVARHTLGVDGAIREYFLVSQRDTQDSSQWRTEIGWPVFQTTRPDS